MFIFASFIKFALVFEKFELFNPIICSSMSLPFLPVTKEKIWLLSDQPNRFLAITLAWCTQVAPMAFSTKDDRKNKFASITSGDCLTIFATSFF